MALACENLYFPYGDTPLNYFKSFDVIELPKEVWVEATSKKNEI